MKKMAWSTGIILIMAAAFALTYQINGEVRATQMLSANLVGIGGDAISQQEAPTCIDHNPTAIRRMNIRVRIREALQAYDLLDLPFDDAALNRVANNEAHDCQRLIMAGRNGLEYQALSTIWVSPRLNETSFPKPTIVAGITRLDRQPYPPLNLTSVKHCLYLQGSDASDNGAGWSAWIIAIAISQRCEGAPFTSGKKLSVYRDPTGPKEIAGRWIDTESGYYIGLQCGEYFCVIGNQKPGEKPPGYVGSNAESDIQRLAKKVGVNLVPSGLTGTITPLPRAVEYKEMDAWMNKRVPVATVTFTGIGNDPEADRLYAQKWNNGNSLTESVTLHLAKGEPVRWRRLMNWVRRRPPPGWRVQYGSGDLQPVEVVDPTTEHSGKNTVRWRWTDDEGTWIQCPAGCCGGG